MGKKKYSEQCKKWDGEKMSRDGWVSAKSCGLRCVVLGRGEECQSPSGPGPQLPRRLRYMQGSPAVANSEASPWGCPGI